MGNRFTNRKSNIASLKLSNGGTDVLFDVLLISASKLAASQWEKNFAAWLAGINPEGIGYGTDGFDIEEIGWTKANFEAERAFVLKVIDDAGNEANWSILAYKPNIKDVLLVFRRLVEAYELAFIEDEKWDGPSRFEEGDEFQICPIHKVYKHKSSEGCRICNTVIYPSKASET